MTVGEMIDMLTQLADTEPHLRDQPVILSSDAEGDRKSPLAETTWTGDVYLTPEQLSQEQCPELYDEAPDGAVRCIVLYPLN